MTSTASQQTPIPAPNASNNASVTSYASAAGASKKSTSTPLVATGTNAPLVATGSSQHAKSNSVSPVNGQPIPIMPAVPIVSSAPAVAHGTSNLNGASDSHSRKPSVTMSAAGPNSYSANGGASKIQFGFQPSPAVSHSTLQGASAPIPIPGTGSNARIPSPQHSPSPIPQPSASGGRPPSSAQPGNTVTFGSFGGNGESHMRRPSATQNPAGPPSHIRNESAPSMATDPSNQGGGPPQGGPPGRGGFAPQGGRGRGGYNPNYNNQQMGYPPNGNPSYRGGPQGRGAMPPNFQPRQQYGPGTPPPVRASPAMSHVMPHTPGMNAGGAPYYYQPPAMGQPMQQVHPPPQSSFFQQTSYKHNKKKGQRGRDSEKFSSHSRLRSESIKDSSHELNYKLPKRNPQRLDTRFLQELSESRQGGQLPPERGERIDTTHPPNLPPMISLIHPSHQLPHQNASLPDLSPESGNFDILLTKAKQYPAYPPPQYDPMRGNMPISQYPMYSMHGQQPHSPAPNFQAPYNSPGQFSQGPQPMSRNPSQASEPRPTSSTGQNLAPQSTSQAIPAQVKQPAIAASPQFTRPPKKSAAITIRNQNGDALDLTNLKAPASPAPSIQQSKTPPVVASTPTPPPKPSTPKLAAPVHIRTDSTATKTQAEVQNEFKEKIARQIADGSKGKDDVEAKTAEDARVDEEKVKEEEKQKAERKAQEDEKAAQEAKAKAEADAKAKEDEEFERMVKEMEEEDRKREAKQAEISKQKALEAEAKKKADEEAKKVSMAENDRKMREQEAEAERREEEKERLRKAREAAGGKEVSVSDLLSGKLDALSLSEKQTPASTPSETASKPVNLTINDKPVVAAKVSPGDKRGMKPPPLNLNTKAGVEPPQPSAALQSLKTAKLLRPEQLLGLNYPAGITGMNSPNPALNAAVSRKGTSFKYDPNFLLQFKTVFTEQPSLEFHQQIKTLIGDGDGSRSASTKTSAGPRQNSRTNTPGFPTMGNFGQPGGGRTLPPGTTSEQRIAMATGQMARPPMNPMSSFRAGGFPSSGSMMSRTPSSSNMAPHSPRQGSTRRNQSKRDGYTNPKAEQQAAKTMPLTAGMKIDNLTISSSGWKPTSIGQKPSAPTATQNGLLDPQIVQRKVKAALNKMTPENFDRISDTILTIAGQSKEESDGRTLRQVIQLTFEKATDEAHWASMYAKFCKRMLETMSPEIRDENIKDKVGNVVSGGALFRKYLLNRCQEEFERGWKTHLPEPKEGQDQKPGEAALLSDEYYIAAAAKRRGLGLVQFIGELFKLGMLTERIMHECVRKLVDYQGMPDEAEVESLCKLLRTIGGTLDSTEKGKPMMDVYFARIQSMIDVPDLPSRLQFMLMDVCDLRKAGWIGKETNKGPKTLEEVRAEAEAQAAQKAAEAARGSQRGGAGGRAQMGRGDARQFSSGYQQTIPNQVGMDDLRRLKGSANRTSSQNISLGPTSMFSSRSNSGRRLGPGGSLNRGAEDSGASSRTGTPPTSQQQSSTNAFSLLANMEDNPASPPSTAASPALSKVSPDIAAAARKE